MCIKFEGRQEMRLKTIRLQEAINNYLMSMKNQMIISIDNVIKYMINKLNYPYYYDEIK
jgi:hypothetical protein